MLLIDIRSTNASAAEFILYRLKLYLAGRHHHHFLPCMKRKKSTIRRSTCTGKIYNIRLSRNYVLAIANSMCTASFFAIFLSF